MSRIGKKNITLPANVQVAINGQDVTVTGPKGTLSLVMPPITTLAQKGQELTVAIADETSKDQRALWGLARSLVNNLVLGVTEGFKIQLEINGIGFKAAMQGKDLLLNVGFSHPVVYKAKEGITFSVEKNVISIEGIDKQLVGQTAAEIRRIKKPEPYKGKGIKYLDETIRRKAGKVVKAGG
ncbi:MAG: 50S ribosomal protein L6 [Candidatus Komeilibacteria bacterium]